MNSENTPLFIVGAAGLAVGGYLLWKYVLPHPEPCTPEGATKCIGTTLFTCKDGIWVLTEKNSPECQGPPPSTDMSNLQASYW